MKKLKFLFLALLIGSPLCIDATKKGQKMAAVRHGKRTAGKGSPRKDRRERRVLDRKIAAAEERLASGKGKPGDSALFEARYVTGHKK